MPKFRGPAEISAEMRGSIEAYYAQGHSVEATADLFGTSQHRMRALLKGKTRNPEKGQLKGLPEIPAETAQAIREYYAAGSSIPETAAHFGLGLNRTGVVLGEIVRRRGGVPPRVPREVINEVVRRWRAYETQQSIARAYNLSSTTVRKILGRECPEVELAEHKRQRHWHWGGGRQVDGQGYVLVHLPEDHPFASMRMVNGYILEHRLLMAEYLGRPLMPSETVHHVNGIRSENRIENLQLRVGDHGPGIVMRCRQCGSCDVQAEPLRDASGEISTNDV